MVVTSSGSAPRVRGTFFNNGDDKNRRRFSPACAGNMASWLRKTTVIAVQPRVCGEHLMLVSRGLNSVGSAPRVRGTLPEQFLLAYPRRFSPACAGNIQISGVLSRDITVQPRVCGEHQCVQVGCCVGAGSAPRVRGTYRQSRISHSCARFSPACAGNIQPSYNPFRLDSVQPRVCGEHDSGNSPATRRAGSAPRVRGT